MKIQKNLYGANSIENGATFEQLIAENENKIQNVIYGMTGDYHLAQDLTQEAFIKAFKAKDTFQGQAKFSTWLYRIAVNVTIDHQRKSCVKNELVNDTIKENISESCSGDPDHSCQKTAIRDILFKHVAQLPEQQKEVFILREINGCSIKETAEIIGCTPELVKWRLHKARSILRKSLQSNAQYRNLGTFNLNGFGLD